MLHDDTLGKAVSPIAAFSLGVCDFESLAQAGFLSKRPKTKKHSEGGGKVSLDLVSFKTTHSTLYKYFSVMEDPVT